MDVDVVDQLGMCRCSVPVVAQSIGVVRDCYRCVRAWRCIRIFGTGRLDVCDYDRSSLALLSPDPSFERILTV